MFGIVLVLDSIARILALEIDGVLFEISIVDVVGAHSQDLGGADQEVKEVDHFHPGVLFFKFLVLRPPFPGNAIGQLGDFLAHCPAII